MRAQIGIIKDYLAKNGKICFASVKDELIKLGFCDLLCLKNMVDRQEVIYGWP